MSATKPANNMLSRTGSGLIRRLRRLGRRLGINPTFAQGYMYCYPIDRQKDLPNPLPGLEVREVTLADEPALVELVQKYGTPLTLERLRGRLERGKRCFAAYLDGQLASYFWANLDVIRVTHLYDNEPVPPDAMYLSDAYTLHEFRGRGILPYLETVGTRQVAAETGRTVIMIIIFPDNRSSLRATRKFGEQPALHRVVIGIFGRKFRFEKRLKPRPER